jgi:hypothetical protein
MGHVLAQGKWAWVKASLLVCATVYLLVSWCYNPRMSSQSSYSHTYPLRHLHTSKQTLRQGVMSL